MTYGPWLTTIAIASANLLKPATKQTSCSISHPRFVLSPNKDSRDRCTSTGRRHHPDNVWYPSSITPYPKTYQCSSFRDKTPTSHFDPYAFFSSPPFFFFPFSFFRLLRSLFFRLCIPPLQTSPYLTKKPSISSGCTMVLSFVFGFRSLLPFSRPFPSVARTSKGSGFGG